MRRDGVRTWDWAASGGLLMHDTGLGEVLAGRGLGWRMVEGIMKVPIQFDQPRGTRKWEVIVYFSPMQYRYSLPRRKMSLPTRAGEASIFSSSLLVARISSFSASLMTTVAPLRPTR
jgi:hypothetical protein